MIHWTFHPVNRGVREAAPDVRASDADVEISAHVAQHTQPALPAFLWPVHQDDTHWRHRLQHAPQVSAMGAGKVSNMDRIVTKILTFLFGQCIPINTSVV